MELVLTVWRIVLTTLILILIIIHFCLVQISFWLKTNYFYSHKLLMTTKHFNLHPIFLSFTYSYSSDIIKIAINFYLPFYKMFEIIYYSSMAGEQIWFGFPSPLN